MKKQKEERREKGKMEGEEREEGKERRKDENKGWNTAKLKSHLRRSMNA